VRQAAADIEATRNRRLLKADRGARVNWHKRNFLVSMDAEVGWPPAFASVAG
jgi:hypothetical protein